jgi:RNA polymerase sigma-70 factor (ECF subfamily)
VFPTRPDLRVVDDDEATLDAMIASPDQVDALKEQELERALQQVAPKYRDAVLLCDVWGFTYDEVADIEEVPIGTVRPRKQPPATLEQTLSGALADR